MTPETLPNAWLLDRIDALESGVRAEMQAGFLRLDAKLDKQAGDSQLLGNRVLVIETRLSEEDKRAMRRGALAGVLAATGLTVVWETVRNMLGWAR